MKTKNQILALMLAFFSLGITTSVSAKNITTRAQQEARVMEISHRVNEIKAMDISTLSKADRKEIKQELKTMKTELRELGPVVLVLSVGAIIVIIIILLLLL